MKEWQRDLLIFISWLIGFEIFGLIMFLFIDVERNWLYFLLYQIPAHVLALTCLAFTSVGIDSVKAQEKQNEWYKKVNEMLKDYESKKGEQPDESDIKKH